MASSRVKRASHPRCVAQAKEEKRGERLGAVRCFSSSRDKTSILRHVCYVYIFCA